MLADLAVIQEIPFGVPVGRQSSLLFRVPGVSKKGKNSPFTDKVGSCTALTATELGFAEKGKCLLWRQTT